VHTVTATFHAFVVIYLIFIGSVFIKTDLTPLILYAPDRYLLQAGETLRN
jgi:hypothetical protein